ncbi:MAG: peptide MFS transporter [Phycisphaeraceae bacterium]|nr:MAG: peptide MFS transporter [Phycisphaeraceae bacterium]
MSDQQDLTNGTSTRSDHPAGLWVLFITEMWERFSYYGMRALLVLYLIASTSETLADGTANTNPGFGWTESHAAKLYGIYTMSVYLTPLIGGWLADKFLGTNRSMLIGGWIIAAGHITLACTEFFGISAGEVVNLQTSPGKFLVFMLGLALIIIGTGFFKPCVSVMVSQLYGRDDPRRDSGFTIFYMGINLGAFLSPLVAGTLGETVGWHWGFGAAAVGMVLGLIFYQIFRPYYLKGIGLPPHHKPTHLAGAEPTPEEIKQAEIDEHEATRPLNSIDFQRIGVVLILALLGNIFFWTAFEQAGSSMNVFAAERTDRSLWLPDWFRQFCLEPGKPVGWPLVLILGIAFLLPRIITFKMDVARKGFGKFIMWTLALIGAGISVLAICKSRGWLVGLGDMTEFPATWYQSVNALTIVACAPIFSWLWIFLAKHKADPSTPMKFAFGLWLLGLSFIAMVFGAIDAKGHLAGPQWLLISYIVVTWGELCLSPVGLSMVTKLAPQRLQSLMMGVWFLSMAGSNFLAGWIAAFSTQFLPGENGEPAKYNFIIEGLPGFYLMLVVFPIGAGVLIALLSPVIKKMMHGRG